MKIILTIIAAIALSGCDLNQEEKEDQSIKSGRTGGTVELINLSDGTKCVVYSVYKGGGIDCDWSGESNK